MKPPNSLGLEGLTPSIGDKVRKVFSPLGMRKELLEVGFEA